MDAQTPGTRAGILLREEPFDLVTRVLGCKSEQARAQLLHVDPKTVYRARRGVIGEEFIAKTLLVMQANRSQLAAIGIEPTFEAMFEVSEKRAA